MDKETLFCRKSMKVSFCKTKTWTRKVMLELVLLVLQLLSLMLSENYCLHQEKHWSHYLVQFSHIIYCWPYHPISYIIHWFLLFPCFRFLILFLGWPSFPLLIFICYSCTLHKCPFMKLFMYTSSLTERAQKTKHCNSGTSIWILIGCDLGK